MNNLSGNAKKKLMQVRTYGNKGSSIFVCKSSSNYYICRDKTDLVTKLLKLVIVSILIIIIPGRLFLLITMHAYLPHHIIVHNGLWHLIMVLTTRIDFGCTAC